MNSIFSVPGYWMVSRVRWLDVRSILALLVLTLGAAGQLAASTLRTQQLVLVKGWNAVWLDVDPVDDRVPAVFDPEKVDVVARYFTPQSQVRFIEDPGEKAWNAPGWSVWYGPTRAEAFLSNLHAAQGGCAYLVHARSACTLGVTGTVRFRPLRWNGDSFNLTGLPVEGTTSLTFARFFSGAAGRLGAQVYRLVEGSWQKVSSLATTTIRPGEAYWIFCEGKTNYQGPLELRFTGGDTLNFGDSSNLSIIELTNRATAGFEVTASIEPEGDLPLIRAVPNLAELKTNPVPFTGAAGLGNLGAGAATQLRLELRRAQMSNAAGSAVIKFSTSDGIVLRVPVRASLQ